MILVMPYIEQDNVFRLYQNWGGNDSTGPRYSAAPNTTNVTSRRFKIMTCPSDSERSPFGGLTNHNYSVNTGTGGTYRTIPNGAPAGFVPEAGMFDGGNRTRRIKLTDVSDGLTNTLMLAEVIQGEGSDLRGFQWWGDAAGFSTFAPPNTSTPDQIYASFYCNNQPARNLPCTGTGGAVFYSRSRHSNGVNVTLGDASVRFITSSISPLTWLRMGSISDGQVINLP